MKEDVYSINDVILPNSDSLTGCDDTRLSVALGHVSHLVQMISIFLQVPNRYPLSVWSSRSRIVDQVSQRELDSQKELVILTKLQSSPGNLLIVEYPGFPCILKTRIDYISNTLCIYSTRTSLSCAGYAV